MFLGAGGHISSKGRHPDERFCFLLPALSLQARLERDLSNKKIYQEEEMPESGAGSEFNRKLREEARRKKYGIILKEFRPEDQPWLLRVNGKSGRK